MECDGVVSSIKKSTIPYTNIMTIMCNNNKKIEMLIHDELLNFMINEPVEVVISETLPEYKDGVDLCGHATFYKDEGEKKLFSIGGFIVVVWNDESNYEIGKKYFMCVKHVSQ